jgi:hypothetical protein
MAEPPIDLCEVQAYGCRAHLARSWLAYDAGDMDMADKYRDRAARLKN